MSGLRSPIRSPLRDAVVPADDDFRFNLTNQALAVLRKFGSNAHVYIPGANGVPISGLSTGNYTLSDGSSGYSAIDGTAGLVLDGAGATVQYNPATVPTGSYDGTGASTVVRTGAGLTFTSAPSGDGIRLTPIYGASDTFSYVKFTASGSGSLIVFAGGSPVTFTLTGTPTQYQCGTAGNSSNWLIFRSNSAGMSASITINEISGSSGIHASQSSGAARPSVRRGLYNQFTYASDTSLGTWTRVNLTPTTGQADPYGGTGATRLQVTTTAATLLNVNAAATSTTQTVAFIVKQGTKSTNQFLLRNSTTATSFDVGSLTGGVVSGTGWTQASLGNGWTVVAYTRSAGITVGDTLIGYAGAVGNSETAGDDWYFYRAGLFAGTLTAAQILSEGGIPLTLAAAASNSGAGRYSWQFDGVNDSLALGSVPFQMSDDHCVIAGSKNEKSVGAGIVFACAGPTTQRLGQIYYNAAVPTCSWSDDAVNSVVLQGVAQALSSTQVISGRKVGNSFVARMNGAVMQSGTLSLGTTTIDSQSIGAHKSTPTNFHNGAIGPVILIKGTISDADLLILERWVASAMPSGPVF